MNRPAIGMNLDVFEDEKGVSYLHRSKYVKAVWENGGKPVLIPPLSGADPRAFLEGIHGLILTGGDDLSPESYGGSQRRKEEVPLHPLREGFDLDLVRAAVQLRIPILAVCLGLQELCVAFGGKLHPHIPDCVEGALDHFPKDPKTGFHPILVETSSRMFPLLGPKIRVMSQHRQAVSEPGEGLKVAARAEDGVIEAVEGTNRPFVIGVQWHPEMMGRTPAGLGLYKALIKEAIRFQQGCN